MSESKEGEFDDDFEDDEFEGILSQMITASQQGRDMIAETLETSPSQEKENITKKETGESLVKTVPLGSRQENAPAAKVPKTEIKVEIGVMGPPPTPKPKKEPKKENLFDEGEMFMSETLRKGDYTIPHILRSVIP